MDVRKQKGSIMIFVLVALLFMSAFLVISYASNVNRSKIASEQKEIIQMLYKNGFITNEDIYNRLFADGESFVPIITKLPERVIVVSNTVTVPQIAKEYVIYGSMGGITEFVAFVESFDSFKALVDDVINLNNYGTTEIVITARGNNGKKSTSTQKVEFIKDDVVPTIKQLPERVIIVDGETVPQIEDPYVTYGPAGGTTTYEVFEEKFSNMEDIVKYVMENNRYEKVDIVINAVGDNELSAEESIQTVEFINDSTVPVIGTLPTPIIICDGKPIIEIKDSYTTFGPAGGTERYNLEIYNEPLSSMQEVIEYIIGKTSQDTTLNITINATGDNGKVAEESIQEVKIIFDSKVPTIEPLPSTIIISDGNPVIPIQDSYVTFGTTGGTEKYTIEGINQEFANMKEIVQFAKEWLNENNLNEVTANIIVDAIGTNTKTATLTQNITFIIDDVKPIIGTLPSTIITNVTPVSDSYVTYGPAGRKSETYTIVEIDETFSTMSALERYVENWFIENNQHDVTINILIKATGNNEKYSESTQVVRFVRGARVSNEAQLRTALTSTIPLFIHVTNDIVCHDSISIDNVNHVLDLNNSVISKTVTRENVTFITLGSNTNLTIVDSNNTGRGKISLTLTETAESDGSKRENSITCIKNYGTLTIESGTIAAEGIVIIEKAKKNTAVDITATAITNDGTVNLNGGAVYANTKSQACSYLLVRNSRSTAYGINSSGTVNLNSGSITTNAESYAVRSSGATVYGQNYATAYGINNDDGTINGNGVTFTTYAYADKSGATITDSEYEDINN